jgi:hypothetical protein
MSGELAPTVPEPRREPPQYEYVCFELLGRSRSGITERWSCRNRRSGAELGVVKWYAPWRRYCYFPTAQAVYSAGCLRDVADFIDRLAKAKKVWEEWPKTA